MSREPRHDRGFSLVELAVYVLVLGVIAAVVATVMFSLFRSEQAVTEVTNASNDSQVISTMLANDIRNAREFRVIGTNEVRASVASSGSTLSWQCVRWNVVATADNALTRQVVPDGQGVPVHWPAGATLTANIQGLGGPYFSGGSSPTAVGTLQYRFGLPAAGDSLLRVEGQLTNRMPASGSTCW